MRNDSCLASVRSSMCRTHRSGTTTFTNREQAWTVMMTRREIRGLEQIQHQGRMARYAALSFVGISMLGGIPVNNKPAIVVLPSAMLTCLLLCGVCWSLMMAAVGKRMRSRCPRCRDLFFGIRKMSFLPLGLRAIWGNHCGSCGLSLRELRAEKVHQAAGAMLHSGAIAATAQGMSTATAVGRPDGGFPEYVALKRPRVRAVNPMPAIESGSPNTL